MLGSQSKIPLPLLLRQLRHSASLALDSLLPDGDHWQMKEPEFVGIPGEIHAGDSYLFSLWNTSSLEVLLHIPEEVLQVLGIPSATERFRVWDSGIESSLCSISLASATYILLGFFPGYAIQHIFFRRSLHLRLRI